MLETGASRLPEKARSARRAFQDLFGQGPRAGDTIAPMDFWGRWAGCAIGPWGRMALLAGLALAGCGAWPAGLEPPATLRPDPPAKASPTFVPSPIAPIPSATPTRTPTPSPTPDPYAGLTIADLAARGYGKGILEADEPVWMEPAFQRAFFTYPSDGLSIHGFMDIPAGEGPFPVVVLLHGYIRPDLYHTLTYTTRYADALARAGYFVLHPNFRNYPPSDDGPNPFRVGYAVDTLNLLALVRKQGGKPGPLEKADPRRIGLFGHSMGGGIAIRVMTVSEIPGAVVLYGAMSGDERRNYEKIMEWSDGQHGAWELSTAEGDLQRISPIYFLDRVRAAVSIHHGQADDVVPPEWSEDLCARLQALGKAVECFIYPHQRHTFAGSGDRLFLERVVAFFAVHLSASTP